MRVDVRPRKRNAPRPAEKSAPGFLQWLRGRQCAALTGDCEGKLEAAHVDYAGDKGMSTKVSDRYSIPLCSKHHRLQHTVGWPEFERRQYGREGHGLGLANAYWHYWPGRRAWEAKNAS